MTPDQVKLVQQSFAKVAPMADQAAVMFYDRLFEIAPAVKSLFPADMSEGSHSKDHTASEAYTRASARLVAPAEAGERRR